MKMQTTHKDHPLLYRQVYDHIVARIQRGELAAHDKLPSIRMLAGELQVHRLTVFRAYQLLKEEGKAYVKEKSGYYVAPMHEITGLPTFEKSFAAARTFQNEMSDIQRVPSVYQFSQALIDPNLLPNLYLSQYVKEVFDRYPKMIGTYSDLQGDAELRDFLGDYMTGRLKVSISADELIITSGAQQAIDLLARLYIRPLDAVMVERPTYSAALDIFRAQGARFLPVDISPGGYDLDQVEEMMKRHKPRFFYMNPTFHNPTGYSVPAGQRKELVALAEKYQCLLVEDDTFRDIYFGEPPSLPLFTYDTEGWVVYLSSFSKYVAPGLRICAVVGRSSVILPLLTLKSLADNGSPLVNQKLFLHYFGSERMQNHLEKLRIALQIRRDLMIESLRGTGWQWTVPEGGLNLWVKLPDHLSVEMLWRRATAEAVSFVPGTVFDPRREMRSWIRFSYSFVNEEQIRTGMRLLTSLAGSMHNG